MIGIVNYGAGNIRAIANIYQRLSIPARVVEDADSVASSSKLILPGVGAFDDSMLRLNSSGLREALELQVLKKKVPILGVCVGMQMMACSSEEGSEDGLGWFANSRVVKVNEEKLSHKPTLPHMGWNQVYPATHDSIFNQVDKAKGFYFLHSYHFICLEKHKLALTFYGEEFVSAVKNEGIYGFQFHPEKSHSNGINIFKNFASL